MPINGVIPVSIPAYLETRQISLSLCPLYDEAAVIFLNDSGATFLVTLDILFQERFMKIHEDVPELKHVIATNIVDYLSPLKQFLAKRLKHTAGGRL